MRAEAKRPWAAVVGYSRAVRIGDLIEVAGTGPADADGEVIAPGDAYGQARACLETIGVALGELGGGFENVIRTRIYVRHMADWEAVGRAHGDVFAAIRPASTVIGANEFIHPEFLVEIEATAVIRR
jgi:enamine deaminase RidA (YjgF/YER057c/UK114 family)